MTARINLTGRRFGRLLVVGEATTPRNKKNIFWECLCDCGTTKEIVGYSLTGGITSSCGCLHREVVGARLRTHGRSKSRAHKIWRGMRQRCFDKNCKSYPRYGGAGVTVCERWNSFENFLADMGDPPLGFTLDRTDNAKGYSPDNCAWRTQKEQQRNRTNNRILEINGVRLCITAWAERQGLQDSTIRRRLHYGWSAADAVLTPLFKRPLSQWMGMPQ